MSVKELTEIDVRESVEVSGAGGLLSSKGQESRGRTCPVADDLELFRHQKLDGHTHFKPVYRRAAFRREKSSILSGDAPSWKRITTESRDATPGHTEATAPLFDITRNRVCHNHSFFQCSRSYKLYFKALLSQWADSPARRDPFLADPRAGYAVKVQQGCSAASSWV
jgi:hypothetical protein